MGCTVPEPRRAGSAERPPLLQPRGGFVCERGFAGCAPLLLLHSWSFVASPSPSWSFSGSAGKELGCVHPSDHALPSHWDFSPYSLSGIFIFLTLNAMQCLFWVWDSCIKQGLAVVCYFAFDSCLGSGEYLTPLCLLSLWVERS